MSTLLTKIYERRELLAILAFRNVKIRYKNSALGFFWTLLNPLFLILIYAVFLSVLRVEIDLPVLVTGIIAWQFLAMCMVDSLHAVVGNANLVTKASFPRIVLPLSMVCANTVNFVLSSFVLFLYLLIVRADFGALYWLPLIMVSQFALCLGVALLFSCLNVFFRDMEHILSVLMLAWFFLTPVIYPATFVTAPGSFPAWVQCLFFANPMTGIVSAYRAALLSEPAAPCGMILLSFGVAWVLLGVGACVFEKLQWRFGDEL